MAAETSVIHGATLIDGAGAEPVRGASVLIEGNCIVAAGRGIEAPRDADVIDAAGMTVMPGMIGCHVQLASSAWGLQQRLMRPAAARLLRRWRTRS